VKRRKSRKARLAPAARVAAMALVAGVVFATMGSTTESARLTPYHWQQTPVGFTMADLEHYVLVPNSLAAIAVRARKAKAWGANTIRLQITQDRLVGEHGERYDANYMHYGANLVYTFHHPVTPWAGMSESNSGSWRASFGYLAANGLPVVDGEFNDDAKTYHLPQPTRREYLAYVKVHHIGMIIFGLSHRLLREYREAHRD
jgi:hypothetical protein